MALRASDWNVVVVGNWNPAILTPSGIAKMVFGLPPGTPIEVQVPLDGIGPARVIHEGIVVMADFAMLKLEATQCTYDALALAMGYGRAALASLPVTPFAAAGFNVRYAVESPGEGLIAATKCALDIALSDEGQSILSRGIERSLTFGSGKLNVAVKEQTDGPSLIQFNFHRDSGIKDELIEWLNAPIDRVEAIVEQLLAGLFDINKEEIKHEQDSRAAV